MHSAHLPARLLVQIERGAAAADGRVEVSAALQKLGVVHLAPCERLQRRGDPISILPRLPLLCRQMLRVKDFIGAATWSAQMR